MLPEETHQIDGVEAARVLFGAGWDWFAHIFSSEVAAPPVVVIYKYL